VALGVPACPAGVSLEAWFASASRRQMNTRRLTEGMRMRMQDLRKGKLIARPARLGSFATVFFLFGALSPLHLPPAYAQTESGPHRRLRVDGIDSYWLESRWKPSAGRAEQLETEKKLVQTYSGRIVRLSNLLALKMQNGNFVWLADVQPSEANEGFGCCEIHSLQDYWPDIGYYVVDVERGETGGTLIISDKTADFIEVKGKPVRDPGNPKIFISSIASDMQGHSAEVWELKETGWRQLYKCKVLIYNTEFFGWEGPGRAIFTTAAQGGPVRKSILAGNNGVWSTEACEKEE
jgi:hypothetical protein